MRQHSTPSAPAVNAGRQRTPARTVSPPFQPAPDLTEASLSDFAVSRARRKTQLICPIRIDITAFVRAVRKAGYDGACSLEYEKDMSDPLLGIAESIGYFRGVMDATR